MACWRDRRNKILISSGDGSISVDLGLNIRGEYSISFGHERASRILRNYTVLEMLPRPAGSMGRISINMGAESLGLHACMTCTPHLDH